MSEILKYFKREKNYIRKATQGFAKRFPKIAGNLSLGAFDSGDPQIERLLEGVSYINADFKMRLERQFSDISSGLLNTFNSGLINPVPSMSVVKLNINPGSTTDGQTPVFPKGAILYAGSTNGMDCKFETSYDVDALPLNVTFAGLEPTRKYEFLETDADVSTVLRIRVECQSGDGFPEAPPKKLRFFLNGDSMMVSSLYETLFTNISKIAVIPQKIKVPVDEENKPEGKEEEKTRYYQPEPVYISKDSISPVGLGEDEIMLPFPGSSHPAYRLLLEYFTFPEKFFFIDIDNLNQHESTKYFDILLMLNSRPALDIDKDSFVLGCTPVINLFEANSAAIQLDDAIEYQVIPDPRIEGQVEVHSITGVYGSPVKGQTDRVSEDLKIEPFFSYYHNQEESQHNTYWLVRRDESFHDGIQGTELYMAFRDLDYSHQNPPFENVFATTLCTNRDLAEKIPTGALFSPENRGTISHGTCLKKPTAQIAPALQGATLWKLVSNLSPNYLSFSSGKESLEALKSVLRTYNFGGSVTSEQQLDGIREMKCQHTLKKIQIDGWRGFCQGLEVTLIIDPAYFVGSSAYLFAMILRQFFSMYCSVNSFIELVITRTTDEGEWKRFEPITGTKTFL